MKLERDVSDILMQPKPFSQFRPRIVLVFGGMQITPNVW